MGGPDKVTRVASFLSSLHPIDYPMAMKAYLRRLLFGGRTAHYLSRPVIVKREGLRWIWRPGSDDALAFAPHEPGLMRMFHALVNEDTVFYDIGAHVGRYAIRAAAKGARVIAFEPHPENARALKANIALNKLGDRITLIRAALSDREEMLTLYMRNGQYDSSSALLSSGRRYVVKCCALDDLIADLPSPSLMKIDVEGYELKVLLGARRTIKKYRPIIMVEVHVMYGIRREQVIELLPGYMVRPLPPYGGSEYLIALSSGFKEQDLARIPP